MKPQVTIELEEYNELLRKSKMETIYDESNHIFNNPSALLQYARKVLVHNKGLENIKGLPNNFSFIIQSDDDTVVVLEGGWWLKLVELHEWINNLSLRNLTDIEEIRISYISRVQSPLLVSNVEKINLTHNGDYYEVYCTFKYKITNPE